MAVSLHINDRLRGQWQGTPLWVDGLQQINPGTGAVVADSGPLTAGAYLVAVHWRATVAAAVNIQHRDAANGTTSHQVDRQIGAAGHDDCIFGSKVVLADQERIRVLNETVVVGNERVNLIIQEVASTPT